MSPVSNHINSSNSSEFINIDGLEKLFFIERLQKKFSEALSAEFIENVAKLLYSDAKPFELSELTDAIKTLYASAAKSDHLPGRFDARIREAFKDARNSDYQYLPRSTKFDTAAHSLKRLKEGAPMALEGDGFLLFDMGDQYDGKTLEQQTEINKLFKDAIVNHTEEIVGRFRHPGKPVRIAEIAAVSVSTFKDNYRASELVDTAPDIYHYANFYGEFVTRLLQGTVRNPIPPGSRIKFHDLLERKERDPGELIKAFETARLAESIPEYEEIEFSTFANSKAAKIYWDQVYTAIEKRLEEDRAPVEKDVFRNKLASAAIWGCLDSAKKISAEHDGNGLGDPDDTCVWKAVNAHLELFAENASNHLCDIFRR